MSFQEQLAEVYDKLQSLSEGTLLTIIEELELTIGDDEYASMTSDILSKARAGSALSPKQKRVLVNFIAKGC